ncbi:hypothetical protein HCH54_005260 [Aspergillus fumigatus]
MSRTSSEARSSMSRASGTPSSSQRDLGLATVIHVRHDQSEIRQVSFRDDIILSPSSGASEVGHLEDTRSNDVESNCTLIEDCDNPAQGEQVCHCYSNTEIDNTSRVFNGDIIDGNADSTIRKHHLKGGSIKNNSKFVNGDLDRNTFIAFFCRD